DRRCDRGLFLYQMTRRPICSRRALVPSGKPCEAVPKAKPGAGLKVGTPPTSEYIYSRVEMDVKYRWLKTLNASNVNIVLIRSVIGKYFVSRASTRAT